MSIYNTGIVTLVSGSATVSGYGTSWLSEIDIGDIFVRRGGAAPFKVSSVDSDTQLQLNANYPGPTVSGVNYDIFIDFSQNMGLAKLYGSDRTDWPVIIGDNLDKIDHLGLGWRLLPYSCTFVTESGFYCSGDKTAQFLEGNRLKVVHGGGTSYFSVFSISYDSETEKTTVVTTSGGIQSPISTVYESLVTKGSAGNFPVFKDTTNGHYYRLEITNGSVVATEIA